MVGRAHMWRHRDVVSGKKCYSYSQ